MDMPIKIVRDGPVLRITLNRPEKRNALNQETVVELTRALVAARTDDSVRVILLTGEGTVFSAGADLHALEALQKASVEENERDSRSLAELYRTIYTHPRAVVARVNGHAIAGGCGLVAASDIAVASEDARLGFTEVRIGFVGAIVSAVLVRKLKGSDVRRLLLTGEIVEAREAREMGLVTKVVVPDELDAEVDRIVAMLAVEASPKAVSLTKELLSNVYDLSLDEALDYAASVNVKARSADDCREGISAFLAKRKPGWAGGAPE